MRNLKRNCTTVYFKALEGTEEIVDEYGNNTGSFSPVYGELQSAELCVSANTGYTEFSMFGGLEGYDRTMTTSDMSCPIDETCILWLDGQSTDEPYNFYVLRRAPSINAISFAIKKVKQGV